jgi:ferric-dicitrate binding protein FerR (iron transport regulator)
MSLQEAKQFVAHFVTGEYTPEEKAAFLQWLSGATVAELNIIADEHEALHDSWPLATDEPSSEWVARLEQKLDVAIEVAVDEANDDSIEEADDEADERGEEEVEAGEASVGRVRRIGRRTWIAAASVVVILSTGAYLYLGQKGSDKGSEMRDREASLTNVFSVARGGEQKELILSDGSKVWLNAASILKYPVTFTGPERLVELSGEAFFQVTRNSGNPFRVLIKDAEVEVLGTDFNVMAYEDEPISRTTLVEGSVKIESGKRSVKLEPGQQAQVPYPSAGADAPIKVLSGIDPQTVLAWKDGNFEFDNADVRTVMRSLARSYNVEVQVDPNVPSSPPVTAVFDRKLGLAKILEQLETLNIAHFKIDGKRVIVTPV